MRGLARAAGWTLLVLLVAFVIAKFFFFEIEELGHDYMAPNILAGDQIAVYTHASPERGDVIVCEHPREPGRRVIGRLVGVAGDEVAIERGILRLDGKPVAITTPEPDTFRLAEANPNGEARARELRLVRETLGSGRSWLTAVDPARPVQMPEVRVESGFFLLSDNRSSGTDSRAFGEVHPSLCKGKAFLLLFPGPGQAIKAPAERRFTWIE